MTKESELRKALSDMKYHKTENFIHRCKIEVDGESEFPSNVIWDIAFSMLDKEMEDELLLRLGIYN